MRSFLPVCLVLLLLPTTPGLRAEVTGDSSGSSTYCLVVGITEGPDPIPHAQWDPVLGQPSDETLNPGGMARRDGRPDISVDPATGWPRAVWAYNVGTDHDIALNEWLGQAWRYEPEFLTSSTIDEVDPRIFIGDDASLYVVWWEDDANKRVLLTTRLVGASEWTDPIVVAEPGRRPTVAVHADTLIVAYERDSGSGGQEVVFAIEDGVGGFKSTVIAETDRTEPLDIVLHSVGRRLWMEWKHADFLFAYSERINGAWVAPTTRPWTDRSWLGQEMMRKLIRTDLLAP